MISDETYSVFDPKTFPGGEVNFVLSDREQRAIEYSQTKSKRPLVLNVRSSKDVMALCLLVDWMICKGIPRNRIAIPYVPYARQDRQTTPATPFSLRAFAKILNSLEFGKVEIYEPHSLVTPALINNCVVRDMIPDVRWCIERLYKESKDVTLVAPDASAGKKLGKLGENRGYITCTKTRDPSTGKLSDTKILSDESPEGKDFLLVDDICDGGGTFIPICKKLLEAGASSVSLFVAHGIFSKGLQVLKDAGFYKVWCSDSWCELSSDDFLTVFPLYERKRNATAPALLMKTFSAG